MLSTNEQNCIREIVELIPFSDLISIGTTVTNNCVKIDTKEDAIKALLLHESSLKSFLTRKKITKNILFNYLHTKEVNFGSSIDKNALVDLIISYWQQQESRSLISQEAVLLCPAEVSTFGHQFTEWFYSRLNGDFTQSECLSEEDFWNDCQTTVFIPVSEVESHNSQATSAKDTLVLLSSVKSQHGLLFSPNLSPEGIKTVIDQHGLVIVMVYGTLHSHGGSCVGLFEQMFGLIKNPRYANNYKIKKINLVLRNKPSTETKTISN